MRVHIVQDNGESFYKNVKFPGEFEIYRIEKPCSPLCEHTYQRKSLLCNHNNSRDDPKRSAEIWEVRLQLPWQRFLLKWSSNYSYFNFIWLIRIDRLFFEDAEFIRCIVALIFHMNALEL